MGKKDIPLYGTIPALGGMWSVTFDCTKTGSTASHALEGYGDFPRDRFPGIPVIDYRGASTDQILKALALGYSVRPKEANPIINTGTLSGYLAAIKAIGIPVI